jgi:copper chaperone
MAMPEIKVKGMSCAHCVAAVTKALKSLPGVAAVAVDLDSGRVKYQSAGPVAREELARVIQSAGFELETA